MSLYTRFVVKFFLQRLRLAFFLIFAFSYIDAQVEVIENKNVVVGTSLNAEPSAKLQVVSKTQGMIMPRMLHSEMESIAEPVDGLMVFVTDEDIELRGFYFFDHKLLEWIKMPTIDCISCENQFLLDGNLNGIPDMEIPYSCFSDCSNGTDENLISISSDIYALCEEMLQYDTYEVFVNEISVTGILELDPSGLLCYESTTINNEDVAIVLYSSCCCESFELIATPSCVSCPACTIDLTVNCSVSSETNINVIANASCTIADLTAAGYTTINVYHHPISTNIADANLILSLPVEANFSELLTLSGTDTNFSLWVTYEGSMECADIIAYENVICTEEDCFCFVANVDGESLICEGETTTLTATIECPDGWTDITFDWGSGSSTESFPDNDYIFGNGLLPGMYNVTVTTSNVNDCIDFYQVHTVEIEDCGEPCEVFTTETFNFIIDIPTFDFITLGNVTLYNNCDIECEPENGLSFIQFAPNPCANNGVICCTHPENDGAVVYDGLGCGQTNNASNFVELSEIETFIENSVQNCCGNMDPNFNIEISLVDITLTITISTAVFNEIALAYTKYRLNEDCEEIDVLGQNEFREIFPCCGE